MWDRKLRADDPWLREKRGERASHLAWPGCSYLRRVGSGDNVSVISADWTVSLIVPLVSECDIWHHDTVWQCLTLSLLTGAYRYHEHELKNKPSSSPAHCSRATIQWNQKPLWVGLMTWCSLFLWLHEIWLSHLRGRDNVIALLTSEYNQMNIQKAVWFTWYWLRTSVFGHSISQEFGLTELCKCRSK